MNQIYSPDYRKAVLDMYASGKTVEDIVRLGFCQFGNNKCVTFSERIDIQKSVMLIVLCYFVTRNLTFDDACEEGHNEISKISNSNKPAGT